MKKIVFLVVGIVALLAGELKILNLPEESKIYINNKIETNGFNNYFSKKLEDGSYDITIKNKHFMPITIKDVEINKDKPTIITLNEEVGGKIRYPVIPIKKFYKTIFVHYKKVREFYPVTEYTDECENINCKVEVSQGFFSDRKKYDKKYRSNLYLFLSNDENKDVKISISSPYIFSTSVSTDALKNERIDFYPISKFSLFFRGAGFFSSNKDVVLSKKNGDTLSKKKGHYFGYQLNFAKRKNTIFNIYWSLNSEFLWGEGSKSVSTDEMYGVRLGLGLGYLFGNKHLIEGGVIKNYLKYDYRETDYSEAYHYHDCGIEPYILLRLYFIQIQYSKSVISFGGSVNF